MSDIKNVLDQALVDYIQRTSDLQASELLQFYEEIEHGLVKENMSYGEEDTNYVRLIYRKDDLTTCTYCYRGTFADLIREIIEFYEQRSENTP